MALPRKSSYLMGGTFDSVAPTLNDGDLNPLELDSSGNLKVNVVAGGGSGSNAAAGPTGSAVPADADYQGVNIGGILTGVTGLALGATTKAPTIAIVDGSGNQITSFGGGTQFADNSASGATPTGTLSMGWDSVNSKIRALKVDASQNLLVALGAALPAGTNVIGHVIVDSGSVTVSGSVSVSNFPATQNVAGTTVDGSTTETNFLVVGGETNDATAQYQPIPLGVGGRSVIIEGTAAVLTPAVGRPVLVGGTDGGGTMQYLPVATSAKDSLTNKFVPIGGFDLNTGSAQVLESFNGALLVTLQASAPASLDNAVSVGFFPFRNGTSGLASISPYVFNAATVQWDRLSNGGSAGTVGVGGAAPSGTAKIANPVQIGGVFNSPQPTVTSGQVVEAQSTASGALIVATGTDVFNVSISGAVISSSPDTAPLLQANIDRQKSLVILECIRRALVAIATDGGRNRENDFDPALIEAELQLLV